MMKEVGICAAACASAAAQESHSRVATCYQPMDDVPFTFGTQFIEDSWLCRYGDRHHRALYCAVWHERED